MSTLERKLAITCLLLCAVGSYYWLAYVFHWACK